MSIPQTSICFKGLFKCCLTLTGEPESCPESLYPTQLKGAKIGFLKRFSEERKKEICSQIALLEAGTNMKQMEEIMRTLNQSIAPECGGAFEWRMWEETDRRVICVFKDRAGVEFIISKQPLPCALVNNEYENGSLLNKLVQDFGEQWLPKAELSESSKKFLDEKKNNPRATWGNRNAEQEIKEKETLDKKRQELLHKFENCALSEGYDLSDYMLLQSEINQQVNEYIRKVKSSGAQCDEPSQTEANPLKFEAEAAANPKSYPAGYNVTGYMITDASERYGDKNYYKVRLKVQLNQRDQPITKWIRFPVSTPTSPVDSHGNLPPFEPERQIVGEGETSDHCPKKTVVEKIGGKGSKSCGSNRSESPYRGKYFRIYM